MLPVWLYSIVSVFVVSSISLVGIFTFMLKEEKLKKIVMYFISFSSGALFGDVFIHLIPEAMAEGSYGMQGSLLIIFGIIASFSVERFLQWRHCHIPTSKEHPHTFAYMNLFGDSIHNFIDGLIIGASYLADIQLGVATTLAVVFHEIPQEIGDFGVLIYGGFKRSKALMFNFLTALTAVFGTILALSLGLLAQGFIPPLIPFAAGNFIYIAGSDLLPELRKDEPGLVNSILQLASFVFGVLVLASLIFLE
jgi:zinc and cadmium transporter